MSKHGLRRPKAKKRPGTRRTIELNEAEGALLEAIVASDMADGAEDVMRSADPDVLRSLFDKGAVRYREVMVPVTEGSIPREKIIKAIEDVRRERDEAERALQSRPDAEPVLPVTGSERP